MCPGESRKWQKAGLGISVVYKISHWHFVYLCQMAILLDPYTTLCTRGLTLESLASSQTCSSSNLLILKVNTVLGFPLQICVENTLLLLTFVCNLAGILSNSLHPPSQTGLNFPKVKTYLCKGLSWWQRIFAVEFTLGACPR